jgi:hypothetical protein
MLAGRVVDLARRVSITLIVCSAATDEAPTLPTSPPPLMPSMPHTTDRLGGMGRVYVTGYTRSADYPTTPGAFDRTFNGGFTDAFVTKLPTG